jgi:hypothetical protein
MASMERNAQAKMFSPPPAGKANIYVYRNESIGALVKMDVDLDGRTVGQTAARTFMMMEVTPGKHTLISKAENDSMLDVVAENGKNHFVWQEVKIGIMYARNKLQLVDDLTGKSGVDECEMIETKK